MSWFPFAGMTRSRFDGRWLLDHPLSPLGSRVRHDIDVDLPPGPSAPRHWQSLQYSVRPYPFFARAHERYGDVFTVKVLRETWVVVCDPASVKAVLTIDPSQMRSGEANYELRPVIGTRNVLLLDGAEHLQRRKLVLPPFHGERLAAYRETMAEVAREHIATWPRGEPFPLLPRMQAITLDVIVRAVFGARADEAAPLRDSLRTLQDWLTGPQGGVTFLLFGAAGIDRLPKFRRLIGAVDDAVAAQIERRRRDPGDDVLSMLLQTDGLGDQDVRDELLTLLIAGHETSSAGLAWAFEALLRHPEALDRAAAREPGWAAAVAIEALRLHPPVPLGGIRRLLAPLEVTGHTLPAGATVTPSAILLHRRPDLYPDPHAFKPERWLDRKPGGYEWVPFGGSVRRCIGASFAQLEMEVVLEEVAARLPLRAPSPEPERVWRRGIILVPAHGALALA
jgi:cytochrome P450